MARMPHLNIMQIRLFVGTMTQFGSDLFGKYMGELIALHCEAMAQNMGQLSHVIAPKLEI